MIGGEPDISLVVEGDAEDFFRGKSLLDTVVLELPDALLIFRCGATQSSTI